MKKYFALIILIFFTFAAEAAQKAQKDSLASINGKIYDGSAEDFGSSTFHPNIQLVTFDGEKADTSYTAADHGVFSFRNIRPQKVYLKVFCVGRKTIEGYYELAAGRNAFFFTMEDAPQQIEESKVTAEVPLMKQIADTTIYNAAAVRTMDGESLRAILEQLPGFKVSRNRITVDGEEIKRTYINGVLVFGDSPLTAVGALKADEVSQVRVYDEQNAVDKRRGLKHSKKDRVLDVVTKEPLLRLAEAGVLGEGGADETGQLRYSGAAALAYYSEMLQLKGFAGADNTGTQIGNNEYFLYQDSANDILRAARSSDNLASYKESTGANIGLRKYWKDRDYGNSMSAVYRYVRKYEKTASQVLTDYFASGANPAISSSDTSSSRSVRGYHNVRFDFDLKDTPLKSFALTAEAGVSDDRHSSLAASETITDGIEDIRSRHETSSGNNRDFDLMTELSWTNNDAAKLRPSLALTFDFKRNTTLSWTVDTIATSFDRRQLSSDGFGNSVYAMADFGLSGIIINDEHRTFSIDAGITSSFDRSKRRMLTIDEIYGSDIDLANTFDNTWNSFSNSLNASFNYSSRHTHLSGGLSVRNTLQADDERYPQPPYSENENTWTEFSSDKSYWSVLPFLSLRYKSLTTTLSASSHVPSVEQTRNRISDTNPLVLTGGNPDLQSEYTADAKISWGKRLAKGYGSLNAILAGNCVFNRIVTKTEYFTENTVLSEWDGYEALAGSRLNTFENAGVPSWMLTANVTARGMFLKRKLNAAFTLNGAFSSIPMYYGTDMIGVKETTFGGSINAKYRITRFMNLSVNCSSFYIDSDDRSGNLLSERLVTNAVASLSAVFAKNGSILADYDIVSYRYFGGIGTDYFTHAFSAELGWSFLKKSLRVYVRAIDMLDRNSLYTESVTAMASTRTWKPVYGRYYMLGFRYVFRHKD